MTISSTTPGLLPTTMGPGSVYGPRVSGIPRVGAHYCRIDQGREGSTSSHHCVSYLVQRTRHLCSDVDADPEPTRAPVLPSRRSRRLTPSRVRGEFGARTTLNEQRYRVTDGTRRASRKSHRAKLLLNTSSTTPVPQGIWPDSPGHGAWTAQLCPVSRRAVLTHVVRIFAPVYLWLRTQLQVRWGGREPRRQPPHRSHQAVRSQETTPNPEANPVHQLSQRAAGDGTTRTIPASGGAI